MAPSPPRRRDPSGRRDPRDARPGSGGERRGSRDRAPGGRRPAGPAPAPRIRKAADPLVGRTIAGHEILDRIAVDAVCVTYKANQAAMARSVAFKVLTAQAAADPQTVASFYETAKAAAQVHHPNIASIYDVASADNLHFCTSEYVEGRPLGELLRARQRIPSADAIRVATDVAEALRFANSKGLPGLRLSADHVILSTRGEVKLLPPALTPPGAPVLDDAYVCRAVGVLLYAMLTAGRVPDLDAAMQPGSAAVAALQPIRTVAVGTRQDIAHAVDRLLGAEGESPYPSAEAAVADLRLLLMTQEKVESRTRTVTERAEQRHKRSIVGLAIAIAAGAVLLGIVVALLLHRSSVARGVERAYFDAAQQATASIKSFEAARDAFYNDPTQAGADAAVAQLEAAKQLYVAFQQQHPGHPNAPEAASRVAGFDRDIAKFREIAADAIEYAAASRKIGQIDDAFKTDLKEKVNSVGGKLDMDKWRAAYAALLNEFRDNRKAVNLLQSRITGLPARVQEAQFEIQTNEIARKAEQDYIPKLQFGKALAAWDAYREKFGQESQFRLAALKNYDKYIDMVKREARIQYAQLANQARFLAGQKKHAEARAVYQKIIDNFGIDKHVTAAKEELAKLPKE